MIKDKVRRLRGKARSLSREPPIPAAGNNSVRQTPSTPTNGPASVNVTNGQQLANQLGNAQSSPSPSPSPVARNLWNEAYIKFQKDHPKVLEKYEALLTKSDPKTAPERAAELAVARNLSDQDRATQLLTVIEDKEEAVKKARWKFQWRKQDIEVQQSIKKIVDNITKAKDIFAFAASQEPHAALVWAGFSTLLPLVTNAIEQDQAAIEGLECITTTIRLYRVVEERYFAVQEDKYEMSESLKAVAKDATDKTVEVYSQIFEYLILLSMKYFKNDFVNFLRGSFKVGDWTALLSSIKEGVQGTSEHFKKLDQGFNETQLRQIINSQEKLQTKWNLKELSAVTNATYDTSGLNEDPWAQDDEFMCLPGTRESLLRQIGDWADDDNGSTVMWLYGPAGVGKSTVARTVAYTLDRDDRLGASFFFKRGVTDRSDPTKVFPALAVQLSQKLIGFERYVADAIEQKPNLGHINGLELQFESLLSKPLDKKNGIKSKSPSIFLVIDAMDECDSDRSGTAKRSDRIFSLLPQLDEIVSFRFRIFITSRPSRRTLNRLQNSPKPDSTRLIDLELEQKATIAKDIEVFLQYRLGQMQDDVQGDWPGTTAVQALRDMAVPLFIFASLVCRYIGGQRPQHGLETILTRRQSSSLKGLGDMYHIILEELVRHPDNQSVFTEEVRNIIGPIVLLADPLSRKAAAKLIEVPEDQVAVWLSGLASVFQISQDANAPVRLYHLSFREFMIAERRGENGKEKNMFYVNETETHIKLVHQCLKLMDQTWPTKGPIYNSKHSGTLRSDVDSDEVAKFIPPELAYACAHWVGHLKSSNQKIKDNDSIHDFLKSHFLHWIEALAWIGKSALVIDQVRDLISLVEVQEDSQQQITVLEHPVQNIDFFLQLLGHPDRYWAILLAWIGTWFSLVAHEYDLKVKTKAAKKDVPLLAMLQDAHRFVLRHRQVFDLAPLQIYSSALIFSPEASLTKHHFAERHRDRWPSIVPRTPQNWDLEIQKLEGHSREVAAVAFSHDGKLLASGSYDETIRIHDAKTGEVIRILTGHSNWITCVAFSPSKNVLASSSHDKTVRLWDTKSGKEMLKLDDYKYETYSVVFSYDGRFLAIATFHEIVLWNTETQENMQKLTYWQGVIAFSPRKNVLAIATTDKYVLLWDVEAGKEIWKIENIAYYPTAIAFSPQNERILALGSNSNMTQIFNTTTGKEMQKLKGHKNKVSSLAFLRNEHGERLISASHDKTIRLWSMEEEKETQVLKGHDGAVNAIAISPNGETLASASSDKTVRLWDMSTSNLTDSETQELPGHKDSVSAIAFSHNGKILASASIDRTILLWDTTTGADQAEDKLRKLTGHESRITAVAFSPLDDEVLVSASYDKTIRFWNTKDGREIRKLEGHENAILCLTYSKDGHVLASSSFDKTVRLWDSQTGKETRCIRTPKIFRNMSFSTDDRTLITNLGDFDLVTEVLHPKTTATGPQDSNGMVLRGPWLRYGGRDVLWIPQEYRGFCSATFGNLLAIGQGSGTVSFLQIDR